MAFVLTEGWFLTFYVPKKYTMFYVKFHPYVMAKCEQDPDPDPHWIGSLDLDPDQHNETKC